MLMCQYGNCNFIFPTVVILNEVEELQKPNSYVMKQKSERLL